MQYTFIANAYVLQPSEDIGVEALVERHLGRAAHLLHVADEPEGKARDWCLLVVQCINAPIMVQMFAGGLLSLKL